ncbi:type VII secretion protein EccE [Streptomyces sodiiphilus]|uniref:Type VII secretion protein EccE n=1 Tax=Streptomyces sodiiphilus TaxID=226217 RepID=A0ABN2PVV8_9ACTN
MATAASPRDDLLARAEDGSARGVVPRRKGGAGGRLPLRVLLCLQAAVAVTLVAWVYGGPLWAVGAAVPTAAVVVLVVGRRRGRPLVTWAGALWALRRRQRAAAGQVLPAADPLLSFATECVPGLRSHSFAGPERAGAQQRVWGRDVGMVSVDGTLTAVLRVEAERKPLQPGRQQRPLPLELLYGALETDGIRLDSVQCVQHTQPAPAPHLPERSVARHSYGPLYAQSGAPALRLTWVALRLDPELCPEAVARRGGGLGGAQRCLTRAADQLASRLAGAGFRATVLSEAQLLSALAAGASLNAATTTLMGQGEGQDSRRTVESSRTWRCDDRWHTTYEVSRWPELGARVPLAELVAMLTSLPAFATTFGLTLRREGRDAVAVAGHVRITARGADELRGVRRGLEQSARRARVGLARMDREQLPGLLATLPLGGVR